MWRAKASSARPGVAAKADDHRESPLWADPAWAGTGVAGRMEADGEEVNGAWIGVTPPPITWPLLLAVAE